MPALSSVPLRFVTLLAATLSVGGACNEPGPAPPPPIDVPPHTASPGDWPRFGYDAGRSNHYPDSTGIVAANVAGLTRQQVALDGTVDSSPIYLHDVTVNGATRDVFFVTTTYGKTIAIDAGDGTILWRYVPPGHDAWEGSYQITTASPVADPDRLHVYASAPDGRIRKLAIADGREVWSTAVTLLPSREKIASALNYFEGRVIATTGGYIGDDPPYQGHVAVLDASNGTLRGVWNGLCSNRAGLIDPTSCSESGSAIWGRSGAVVDTLTGELLVTTGDGRWDGSTMWGDAVIALDRDATRIVANYTPSNTSTLEQNDVDLGSTSPVLLGSVVAQGGKDGNVRLLERAALSGTAPHTGNEAQIVASPSGVVRFTSPAVMRRGGETWLFAADRDGTAAFIVSGGRLQLRWSNSDDGTSPVVAGGLLYVYDPRGGVRVYDPVTGNSLTTLPSGSGHWNSPIVVDGRIALPEGNANAHSSSGVLNIWRVP